MAVDSILAYCGGCQAKLEEDPHTQIEQRRPCPRCGSLSRRFEVNVSAKVSFHSKLNLKGRRAGGGQPFVEQTVGSDLHRKTGRWMRLHRIIDRVKNWYYERVTDPATGEVVHECDEPLTAHTGHGSAKASSKPTDGT